MWKRDEAVRPPQPTGSGQPPAVTESTSPRMEPLRQTERDKVNIGKSVIIKGELSGSEDLTIEGQVEGKIELRQNVLTIGPNAKIKAQVFAKAVVIQGEVHGNVTASEKVDIRDAGSSRRRRVGAARGDCRRRALPRQHRHAAAWRAGQTRRQAGRGEDGARSSADAGPGHCSPLIRLAALRCRPS